MSNVYENSTWLIADPSSDEDFCFEELSNGETWLLQRQVVQQHGNIKNTVRGKGININWAHTGSRIHIELANLADKSERDLEHIPHELGRFDRWHRPEGSTSFWIEIGKEIYFGWRWETIESELGQIQECVENLSAGKHQNQNQLMSMIASALKRHSQPIMFSNPYRLVMFSQGTIAAAWMKLAQEFTGTSNSGICEICSKAFHRGNRGGPRRTYCSNACKSKSYRMRRRL